MNKSLISGILFCLCSLQLSADGTDTIVPDRPGFSTGTYTVQPGRLNVEVGYDYTYNNTTNTQTMPLAVLRTGISEDLEFDFMWDGIYIEKSSSSEIQYSKIVTVGGKYRLIENDTYNISLMGLIGVPTDTSNSKNMEYFAGLLWDYAYSDFLSFFGTLQSTSYKDNNLRVYDIELAIGSSFVHTDKLSTFLEIYTIQPQQEQIEKEDFMDGGVMYLISKNIQIDMNIGLGLNSHSDNYIGAGVAIQF
ncbi:transporter [Sulfurimonas sp.]|uniref:transporter n=1 Tax=Sulfurimonas sp. TaxID=2022749 RepID=UPI00262AC36C|nr:transporter [Sulfurimonas sp.]